MIEIVNIKDNHMIRKCLLLKTKDNRKFLTHRTNLPSLIGFTKTFSVEVYYVKPLNQDQILDLNKLAASMCDANYRSIPEYEVIERIYPKSTKTRQEILDNAKNIRKFIKEKLMSGIPISLKQLKEKYKNCNITDACLCTHLSSVRKELSKDGHSISKMGAGKYKLEIS